MEGEIGLVLIEDRPGENCLVELPGRVADALDRGGRRLRDDAVDGGRFQE